MGGASRTEKRKENAEESEREEGDRSRDLFSLEACGFTNARRGHTADGIKPGSHDVHRIFT